MQNRNTLQQRRVSIRKQRRRDQIQTLFASKRKLLLAQYSPPQTSSLVGYFELLLQHQSVSRNLHYLSNLLADQNPFEYFSAHGPATSKQQIQQFCINLCEFILKTVFKYYHTDSKQDSLLRITCLTVISNLLADRMTPNHLLFGTICSFLKETYYSLDVWGVDKEIIEVGWMLANLIGKEADHILEEDMSYVLQWVQELIVLDEPGLLAIVYKNLGNFITEVQKKYRVSGCIIPQVHVSKIINILTTTIQKNLNSSKSLSVLAKVMQFLNQKIYLLLGYCPKSITQTIISQVIPLIGFVSKQLSVSACNFLKKAVGACNLQEIAPRQRKVLESMQKIRVYIAEHYSAKMMQYLLLKQIKLKKQLIKFIQTLITSPTVHINFIIALLAGAGLEDVLVNVSKAGDSQLSLDILHLAYDIQRISEGKYGLQFVMKVEAERGQISMSKPSVQSPI